jgi:hypothetical protein
MTLLAVSGPHTRVCEILREGDAWFPPNDCRIAYVFDEKKEINRGDRKVVNPCSGGGLTVECMPGKKVCRFRVTLLWDRAKNCVRTHETESN